MPLDRVDCCAGRGSRTALSKLLSRCALAVATYATMRLGEIVTPSRLPRLPPDRRLRSDAETLLHNAVVDGALGGICRERISYLVGKSKQIAAATTCVVTRSRLVPPWSPPLVRVPVPDLPELLT
jgi:hypothetical protein